MDNETLKLTSVLADPTRFSIYQYIVSKHGTVTVQEIAEQFDIHPNVARLHLTKLEDVNLLTSTSEKTGKGGRPSRLYSLSDQMISLQFPPRDYQLLANIAIETLVTLGEEGQKALYEMGRKFGHEAARQAIEKERVSITEMNIEEKIASIQRLVVAQGLHPEIELTDGQNLRFRVFNCTFKEAAINHPESICRMHHALLLGIFETYFGKNISLIEENSMLVGCKSCDYTMLRLS
ncbi:MULTISPECIES: helix-turn-helix transcriptional regulator [Aneurinibacillus]|uniref:Helix-turn-helix domain-containing protein n=1 Tax=Aneurinibacillus thermoaerophilus TaxID=143495 RepID=A0A1G7W7G1_ANETH|nr:MULTISPECIES: helix-turn-helix domain-containing protein [Aneurinibacillus]AMA72555.1 transcriptional regulator [Aneurinibacillus sp. XH2]MED0674743.1 helix-turn-helix domain-containing protein [Aneurinibacillus thermoaerophilus]MED0680226.1 helix-turn-helix domain-containing protein [Aneurinibacillus thermoaerophilus]MED0736825.1 helix-turn-helix domain-containing protein [Aneurinibacillus thermoaerophilus]MED0756666.1 helix-turn-helix domain-containing protein [Aneurinibacillus thermoaero